MGIYDTDRGWAQQIKYTGTHPDAGVAFKKSAEKFIEVLQGQVEIGYNEGFDTVKSVQLGPHTVMNARVQQAGDEALVVAEIQTNLPEEEAGVGGEEIAASTRCPLLPLSRPGRRLFTQLFGHDVKAEGQFRNDIFRTKTVDIVQTPYITPSLEQGRYCSTIPFPGEGSELFHGEVSLQENFPYLGLSASTLYIHDGYVGVVAPNVFLSFFGSVLPKEAPCTMDFNGFPLFVPNFEALGPGNNYAMGMTKNAGGNCNNTLGYEIFLTEGTVIIGLEEILEQEGFTLGTGVSGLGSERKFAAITWIGKSAGFPQEREIVLLYATELCPAAIGFFYGGEDGVRPWQFKEWVGCPVEVSPTCLDVYLIPRMCKFSPPGHNGSNFVPQAHGAYIMGAKRIAHAWVFGEATSANHNDGAHINLNSRSFWFETDGQGFPSGRGLHNGPLEEVGAGQSQGVDDLAFR